MAEARRHFQQGRSPQAQEICNAILARAPQHVHALNLLGVIAQASGRHQFAVKCLAKAIASDELNAACHYNIASSYQALGQPKSAAAHFKNAIALGLNDKKVEEFILQSPVVAACLERLESRWPLRMQNDELFGAAGLAAIANDIFLRCAMETILIRGKSLEVLLTHVRSALLDLAHAAVVKSGTVDAAIAGCLCSLAQQCFINEYVYSQSEDEVRQAGQLRDLLSERLAAGGELPPILLAAVAAYFPLHGLPGAESLLGPARPDGVAALLLQQVREPLEERRDRGAIPALTPIDDDVSLRVMQQYEENPYPRWTTNPFAVLAGERALQAEADGDGRERGAGQDILIAGCGTGQHAFQVAQYLCEARVLAVDISLASLAYARRKTREQGLRNIEYAQADILKLASLGRSFDRIEAVGVLHHLADPKRGWQVLLSLLRPGGEMRIGLYSEAARRAIVEARALIAERGYRATADDIRKFRQEVLRDGDEQRWRRLTTDADFYSMSGCRDLLFNVMEHRFTIPEIKAFLQEQELTFLGFDLPPESVERFQRQFPGAVALNDLDCWDAFEAANPLAFRHMYIFTVCKQQPGSRADRAASTLPLSGQD